MMRYQKVVAAITVALGATASLLASDAWAQAIFTYTGSSQSWIVPPGVTAIAVDARGAQGAANSDGASGGLGGRVQATLSVTPGQTLDIYVGGAGFPNSGTTGGSGGFNGGGRGGNNDNAGGAGGGGASDVRIAGTRVVIAAGGGGAGGGGIIQGGGGGGGSVGSNGADGTTSHGGTGATQLSPGNGGTGAGGTCHTAGENGAFAQGGQGADCTHGGGGGGGGAGFFGGGGGEGTSGDGAGGGGGSSLIPSGGTPESGVQSGDGVVSITYTVATATLTATPTTTATSTPAQTLTPTVTPTPGPCGNGTVDSGEQCDDGNTASGDGCSSTCRWEGQCSVTDTGSITCDDDVDCAPALGACIACGNGRLDSGEECDDGNHTVDDGCDSSCQVEPPPACGPAPQSGCRRPIATAKASLLLKDRIPDKGDLLQWKWTKGAATVKADFGDPMLTTNYTLCLYDDVAGTPKLKLRASIPGGGTCHGRPCWKENTRGYKYADKDATPNGITKLALKEGLDGGATIQLQGRGVPLEMPTLPLTQAPTVLVQLKNDSTGLCWEAPFSGMALRNDQSQFTDKGD